MMRYCAKFPNSVGFVISQDGDVRAITKVGERLVLWDNVRLQLHDWLEIVDSLRACPKCAHSHKKN